MTIRRSSRPFAPKGASFIVLHPEQEGATAGAIAARSGSTDAVAHGFRPELVQNETATAPISMSCETFEPSEYGRRWRELMHDHRVDYRRYRAMMGVCDNTARAHLDDGRINPRASQIALACAAFGTVTVMRALFGREGRK